MSLNLAERAQPATRLRLVYRISAGAVAGASGVSAAVDRINTAWMDETGQIPAFLVSRAANAVQGGTTGAGALGVATMLSGRNDWFVALDIKTETNLPAISYDQLLSPLKRVPLGFVLGSDVRADLDHADLISTAAAATPSAQTGAARATAQKSAESDVPTTLAGLFGNVAMILVIVGGLVLLIVARSKT